MNEMKQFSSIKECTEYLIDVQVQLTNYAQKLQIVNCFLDSASFEVEDFAGWLNKLDAAWLGYVSTDLAKDVEALTAQLVGIQERTRVINEWKKAI